MDHFTQHWMISWCSSQVRGMIPNIITQENDIVRYVVHSRETHSATGQGVWMAS